MKLVVSVMPKNLEEAQNIDSSRYDDADIMPSHLIIYTGSGVSDK